MITSRTFSFFILLALIGLLLPSLLIPFWASKIKREVDLITKKPHQEILSAIESEANTLLPMNSSASNLAKVATTSLTKTHLTSFDIQTKVAPLLFQALLTIPHLSQISYIRKDGLFFALYYIGHQEIFAIYSNTSTYKAATGRYNYSWYTQPVDYDTGKLYGDAVVFAPQLLINETWFQQALNTTNPCASLAKSWNNVNYLLVLNAACVDKTGVISLGFELRSLTDVLSRIIPVGGGFYMATKDGNIPSEGIPNTRMLLDGNSTIYFQLLEPNGDRSWNGGNITLQLNDKMPQASILDISGTKYVLYYSSLDIIGMQTVYVLALPCDGLHRRMHKNIILVFMLLSVMFITVAISTFTFVALTVRAARKEMCLRAALIKQKEATAQAERKSKNQSLAFVTASHDIRASLAGITGLLEMSISEVHQGSELAKNLRLMQICSEDLHGILNSVLDTSKIEAGKMQLEEKHFDLAKVLEGVVDLFYPVGLKKKVDVILDLHDGSLTKFAQVKGDERRLKQILSNLLSNAIKFTSEGYVSVRAWARKHSVQPSTLASTHNQSARCLPCFFFKNEVHIDLEAIDDGCRNPNLMEFIFEVNDTGKGIPKDKHASIFENYVQVKETAPELEGTGLGLGIVQSLVRMMGGDISIVNKEIGEKGTCFRFNAFFKVCRSDLSGISEDDRIESLGNLSSGPNTLCGSPKRQGYKSSLVVLFISRNERRRMAQKFLVAKGVKVLAVENVGQLSETLKELRQEQRHIYSSRSDLNFSFGYLSWPTSLNSSTKSKEVPLSALDGADVSSIPRANQGSVSNFILLVIDPNGADFRELCKAVAEFRKDAQNACFRVVWLGSRCIQLQGLDEKKLPPSDIIIPMPLHGSHLYSLIGLLPEFGGTFPCVPSCTNHQEAGMRVQNHHPPRKQEEIQEIARPRASCRSALREKRVLLAEDDSVQQTIAKTILLKHGATIHMCKNGKEALTMVYKGLSDQRNLGASYILPYEYILMDCQMPVMDGCEATRRIRLMEKDYGVHIPIIALTAHAAGEELNKLFAAGIDIHVPKPLNEQKLLKVIEDLHSRK